MPRKSVRPSTRSHSLRLPELQQAQLSVLHTLVSPCSRRAYRHALEQFIAWYCSEPRLALNRVVVLHYRIHLEQQNYAASTINLRLAAVRRLAYEAADTGLLSPDLAAGIRRVKGVKRLGFRVGHWLTAEQARTLVQCPAGPSLRSVRDRAILSVLLGCGLRRTELLNLRLEEMQLREGRWVIADLLGKGRRIRTVPMPGWVKVAVDRWIQAAGLERGRLFRSINKQGKVWSEGVSAKVIWQVVRQEAQNAGIPQLAPHDLRRTCARLCHVAGGELEQIQFLLGHVSVQTTERYLGCKQKLQQAVNDRLGIEPELPTRD